MKALITESIRDRLLEKWVVENFSGLTKHWDGTAFDDFYTDDELIMFYVERSNKAVTIRGDDEYFNFNFPREMLGCTKNEILWAIGRFITKTYGIKYSDISQLG